MYAIRYPFFSLILLLGLLQGCGGSTSSSGGNISVTSANGGTGTGLQTLSTEKTDLKSYLEEKAFNEIVCNISKLYNDATGYPETMQKYAVQMHFAKKEVLVYADCQKITANYKVRDDALSFSNISIAPAVELASCQEYEYADDAVLGFFENSYTVEKIRKNEIVLEADEIDTSVVLKR